MRSQTTNPFVMHAGSFPLASMETMEFNFILKMMRRSNDTEVWKSFHPSDSLHLTITDSGPSKRHFEASSIHPDKFEEDSVSHADGRYEYRLSRYMLPYHGFVLNWYRI